jgi:adenosylcobinamide-phosphate synthase
MPSALVFLAAGALDAAVGDPEGWPHPVRIFGWIIARLDAARMSLRQPWVLRMLGLLLASGLPTLAAATTWATLRTSGQFAPGLEILLGAWMLAGRSLHQAVSQVLTALQAEDLPLARAQVGRIVGRDTNGLEAEGVTRAALETLAESLSDGLVAPLFWFALAGLPGLWAFKAISTLDSMVGHRESPWTHFGWASARLDDAANWAPARLAALLIALMAPSWTALRMALRDARRHASPNAGWPEAALAGALGLQLGGLNHYDGVPKNGPHLGDPGKALDAQVLRLGLALAARVQVAALALGALALWCWHG